MDGNIQNTPPVIPVPRMEDRPRFQQVAKDLAAVREKLSARKNRRETGIRYVAEVGHARQRAGQDPHGGSQVPRAIDGG